jgi:hypothetical protein
VNWLDFQTLAHEKIAEAKILLDVPVHGPE